MPEFLGLTGPLVLAFLSDSDDNNDKKVGKQGQTITRKEVIVLK